MPEEKICAYEIKRERLGGGCKCSRPVWEDGGPDEKYCLFHSTQYERKEKAFKQEFELFMEGQPSEYLLGGEKSGVKRHNFVGFKFPAACSNFYNFTFNKCADFNAVEFNGNAGFNKAKFSKGARFFGATFGGDALFDNATFGGNARFDGATFKGYAGFTETIFNGNVWFSEATFFGKAVFNKASFNGYAVFNKSSFSKEARFFGATFSSIVRFNEATFRSKALFNDVTLVGNAEFNKATFSGDTNFDKAKFSEDAEFSKTTFSEDTEFSKAAFSKDARFYGTTFSGDASFPEAIFSGEARFDKATFNGGAWFERSTFSGFARFDGASFSGVARFNEASFNVDARFEGVTFNGDAWFEETAFKGGAWFEEATFSNGANFHEAAFSGSVWFERAAFGGDALLIDIVSKDAEIHFENSLLKKNVLIRTYSEREYLPAVLIFKRARIIGNVSIEDSEIKRLEADNLTYRRVLTLRNVVFRNEDLSAPSSLENVYLERAKFTNIDLSTVALGGPFIREVVFDRIKFGRPTTQGWQCSSWLLGRPNEAIYEERYARYGKKSEEKLEEGEEKKEVDPTEGLDKSRFLDRIILWLGRFRGIFGISWLGKTVIKLRKKRDRFGAAETVYRTLKHEMEKQHAKGLSRRMRAGELECKLHGEANFFQKIFLFGYRFLNGFGLRWIRALVFWLACILSFAVFFYDSRPAYFDCYRETVRIEDGNVIRESGIVPVDVTLNFGDALLHSLQMTSVVMRPSKIISSPDIGWIEFAEKILSPALLFLFLQAARNTARD